VGGGSVQLCCEVAIVVAVRAMFLASVAEYTNFLSEKKVGFLFTFAERKIVIFLLSLASHML
jgi:hypothetical protein